jgi:hypothetical protein
MVNKDTQHLKTVGNILIAGVLTTHAEAQKGWWWADTVSELVKKRVTELRIENNDLKRDLDEIRGAFESLEKSLPESISRPEVIIDTNGNLTPEGRKWLDEIFPWQINTLMNWLNQIESNHSVELFDNIAKITLYIVCILALLVVLAGMQAVTLPFRIINRGVMAYHETLKILQTYLPAWLYNWLKKKIDETMKRMGIKEIPHENWEELRSKKIGDTFTLYEPDKSTLEITITKIEPWLIIGTIKVDGVEMEIELMEEWYFRSWEETTIS